MPWRRAMSYAIPVPSLNKPTNKNAVLAHLEHSFAAPIAILASKIPSVIIPIPRPAVVAIILADARTQPTQNRVRNLVVSSTLVRQCDEKEAIYRYLYFFFAGNFEATDIVFTNAALNLWACCYEHPGLAFNCSGMYSEHICVSSFPCFLSRHHHKFIDRYSSRGNRVFGLSASQSLTQVFHVEPGNETFYAPSPQSLTGQVASSSATTSSSASASTSSTNSPTSTGFNAPPRATPTHASSSALSAGGKAGISVAASIVGLGILILLGLYLLRKRRPRQCQEDRANESRGIALSSRTGDQRHALEISAEQQWEIDGSARSEVEARGRVGG